MAKAKRSGSQKPPSLKDEIAHMRDLDIIGLRNRWKSIFRSPPPDHLPRHLLVGTLAYQIQAETFGELDPAAIRLLKQIGCGGAKVDALRLTADHDKRQAALKTGTILMREWNGQSHRVMVVDSGFTWNGKTHDSLSKIAFAITGTKWNGPRFFGLRDKPGSKVQP